MWDRKGFDQQNIFIWISTNIFRHEYFVFFFFLLTNLRCQYVWIDKILIIIFYSWKITVCQHFLWYKRNIQGPKINACELHTQSSFQRHLTWPCSVHMPEWPKSHGYLTASKNTFHRPEYYQPLFPIFIIDINLKQISTMLATKQNCNFLLHRNKSSLESKTTSQREFPNWGQIFH